MLLQLAIDRPQALAVVRRVRDLVDIVEVGTPMLLRFGLSAISTVRELAPGLPVLADTKTVDGGAGQAEMVFAAGATFMTVLSSASVSTLEAASRAAQNHDGYIVVDTITDGWASIAERGKLPERCAVIALHSGVDVEPGGASWAQAGSAPVDRLHELGYRVAVAGGIDKSNLDAAVHMAPEILVIGRTITDDPDPRGAAEWISVRLTHRGHGWPWEMR